MDTIYSFTPVADENSRILILGSIPGKESLRKQQYYGHERNIFWRVIYTLMGEVYQEDYEEKKRFLLRNGIALWDVVFSCQREGSLDANIRNAVINDFAAFFADHPCVSHVYFNGRTAYNMFKRHIGFNLQSLEFIYLGSTSPAHAVGFDKRLADWSKILKGLGRV